MTETPVHFSTRRSARARARADRGRGVAFVAALAVLLLVGPGLPTASAGRLHPTVATPTFAIGNTTVWTVPAAFWGTDVRVYYAVGSSEAADINQTRIHYIRWPGGAVADRYNMTANRITDDNGSSYTPQSNESQFIGWCRLIHCQAIFQLPGEIDDPATAAYYVHVTETTYRFHPSYWEIGNEPAQWTHFGVPWSAWTTTQATNATPGSYAQVVRAYALAIHRTDPLAQLIGLPGVGTGAYNEAVWIRATVQLNGPNLSAVAIHVYPAGGSTTNGTATAASFFATLDGNSALPQRLPADRAALVATCGRCHPIALFVDELGSGTQGGPYDRFMAGFATVPYLAAEIAQALANQVPNVDLYAFRSGYNGSLLTSAGGHSLVFQLYSAMLSHLQPDVLNTTLAGAPGNFFLVATANATRTTEVLLAVNANTTASVRLDLAAAGLPLVGPGAAWTWNATTTAPVATAWSLLAPSQFTLPARSVAVIELGP
jgi:hypothetical protein